MYLNKPTETKLLLFVVKSLLLSRENEATIVCY